MEFRGLDSGACLARGATPDCLSLDATAGNLNAGPLGRWVPETVRPVDPSRCPFASLFGADPRCCRPVLRHDPVTNCDKHELSSNPTSDPILALSCWWEGATCIRRFVENMEGGLRGEPENLEASKATSPRKTPPLHPANLQASTSRLHVAFMASQRSSQGVPLPNEVQYCVHYASSLTCLIDRTLGVIEAIVNGQQNQDARPAAEPR